MIEVIDVRDRAGNNFMITHVYIGRGGRNFDRSPLANNHRGMSRTEVISRFRGDLWAHIKKYQVSPNNYNPVVKELIKIASYHSYGWDVRLMCHCAPRPCHGDVVKKAAEWLLETHPGWLEVPSD